MFRTFPEVEAYLNSLVNFEHSFPLGGARDRPKLQPVLDATARLDLNCSLPNCLHIAGTVGKGSVAGYLEAILSTRFRTLSFTSPHLISVAERVRFNGQILEDQLWRKGFESIISKLNADRSITLTYFEAVFVFYLWVSRELNCECHVVETGLGGSFDATNVLANTTAVLTRIDYDHTAILGETLSEIAADKCGIIKPDSTVISSSQHGESLAVIESIAKKQRANLSVLDDDFSLIYRTPEELIYKDSSRTIKQLRLTDSMDYRCENAAVAISAALSIVPDLSVDAIRQALAKYLPQARQQLLPGMPPIILDTAHNPAAFKVLAETLKQRYEGRRIRAVIGMMKDKDARQSLALLRGIVEVIMTVSTGNPRSYSPDELCEIATELGIKAHAYSENKYAYIDLHENPMISLGIITGSFYVAGDYLKWRERAGISSPLS